MTISEVMCHFGKLEDPRSDVNRKHPFVSVVVLTVMGVLARAGGPTGIAKWAKLNRVALMELLPLPNGVPCKDVFRRVLCALKPGAFQECFATWLETLRAAAATATGIEQPVYAVDGKTLRRSHNAETGLAALHAVTIWASEFGLTLAQVATDQKSNEITAIPAVLKLISIKGAIITIDAMGTQTEIAKQIVEGEADYVLGLKGNQGLLHEAVIEHVVENMGNNFANVKARRHVTEETGHGRRENREYIQMPAPKTLPGFEKWKGLLTIGVAILTCICKGKETTETRYFISSLPMGVKNMARAIRSHWGIENSCHWCLDVTYREDESRIRDVNARENFAWLNRFTLSLLKQHPGKDSVAMKRNSCSWSIDFLIETITGAGKK
jgi:predicted transposase YbfD/YdcC